MINSPPELAKAYADLWRAEIEDVLANVRDDDLVYMDPPYQGVCGERDSRYFAGISFEGFVEQLEKLNRRHVRYLVSYDGRLGKKSYGKPLPAKLDLTLVELEAGRSSQATLLGRDEMTVESMYLAPTLAAQLEARPVLYRRREADQMRLFDHPLPYGKKASKRVR